MFSGEVIGIARGPASTLLHVSNPDGGHPTTSVRVVEERSEGGVPIEIAIGDSVWWGRKCARWTPKAASEAARRGATGFGITWDIKIPLAPERA